MTQSGPFPGGPIAWCRTTLSSCRHGQKVHHEITMVTLQNYRFLQSICHRFQDWILLFSTLFQVLSEWSQRWSKPGEAWVEEVAGQRQGTPHRSVYGTLASQRGNGGSHRSNQWMCVLGVSMYVYVCIYIYIYMLYLCTVYMHILDIILIYYCVCTHTHYT